MCVIAGYVGKKQAAPILIDMLKKQESMNGGCYTGIATIDNGKIYYAKICGDVDWLVKNTDAASLPGTIGIMHGRTPGSAGDEGAHPFIGYKNGEAVLAYLANGNLGLFRDRTDDFNEITRSLADDGYQMDIQHLKDPSAQRIFTLSDGSPVHISDVMCQLILRYFQSEDTLAKAMEKAYCRMPSAIVGLALTVTEPDSISWSRINAPMHIGFASHGTYLASSPMALPEDIYTEPQLLMANSSGRVFCDRYETLPYQNPTAEVAPMNAKIRKTAYDMVVEKIRTEEIPFLELSRMLQPLFGENITAPTAALLYDVLWSLEKQGLLKLNPHEREGMHPGVPAAPLYHISLKEKI